MKVELLQQQTLFAFHEKEVVNFSAWVMGKVLELAPSFQWEELSLVFTDDRIRGLNHEWFGKDTVTDVISFAYPGKVSTGEVIVNVQQAYEEGRLRTSPDQELALYISHGCHHLMGAEDDTEEKKTQMLQLEQSWVNETLPVKKFGPFFK